MAKTALVNREKKRRATVKKFAARRAELIAIINNSRASDEVRAEIRRRQAVYRAELRPSSVEGRAAIIVDDGLASGYTMMAAMRSIRRQGAAKVVAAAPVASSSAWELIKSAADEVVCPIVSYHYPFAVASFYRHWHDLTDEEAISDLAGFRKVEKRRAHD